MQATQEINWWAVILPSLIMALFTIIVQILIAFWLSHKTEDYKNKLSREIEDYKKDIVKEIEIQKFQMQSEFQTQFYQFQTKFSLFHQKRSEIIHELFPKILNLENLVHRLAANVNEHETPSEVAQIHFSIKAYFESHQFYFDTEFQKCFEEIMECAWNVIIKCIAFQRRKSFHGPESQMKEVVSKAEDQIYLQYEEFVQNFKPLMTNLEKKLREIISIQESNHQLEKNDNYSKIIPGNQG